MTADPASSALAGRSARVDVVVPPVPARRRAPTGDDARPPRTRTEILALIGLLAVTAVLYVWGLDASGWANSFYSAAAQAGSESWTAFLYGASDAAGSITVDKPPAAIWVMALSVRLFGLSSWSVLVPQALMGVASVGVLYATVRRRFPAGAALLAGAVLALTPVAALMFRFNNPDALLVLLTLGAVFAVLRAVEGPRTTRWMVLAGALVGLAFLTKQLQAFLILPGLGLVFLGAAPVGIGRRIRDGLLGIGAMVVTGGWWVALVELVPESWRPYIGGSQDNSFLELTFGYNGLGRLTGDEEGAVGGGMRAATAGVETAGMPAAVTTGGPGGTGGGAWGETGITRLFTSENGGQITWLVPAAILLGLAALWTWRRAPRTDLRRANVVLWLALLLVTGLTFSFMAGIFHAYYDVALAPYVAALVGTGGWAVWRQRRRVWVPWVLAVAAGGTTAWAFVLLGRTADWLPWLRWAIVAVGAVATLALVAAALLPGARAGAVRAGVALALVGGLAGPTAYTLQTVTTGHSGSIVTAGPETVGGFGGRGGPGGPAGARPPGADGAAGTGGAAGTNGADGQAGAGPGQMPGGTPGMPDGMPGGATGTAPGGTTAVVPGDGAAGGMPGGVPAGAGERPAGMGGLLGGAEVSDEVAELLLENADSFTWAAATTGSQNAAAYQLATEEPVMPIGGFNGSDPSPTLEEFQELVERGEIHWYIGGGGMGGGRMGGSNVSAEIQAWVEDTFTATTIDDVTLYDLTASA